MINENIFCMFEPSLVSAFVHVCKCVVKCILSVCRYLSHSVEWCRGVPYIPTVTQRRWLMYKKQLLAFSIFLLNLFHAFFYQHEQTFATTLCSTFIQSAGYKADPLEHWWVIVLLKGTSAVIMRKGTQFFCSFTAFKLLLQRCRTVVLDFRWNFAHPLL